MKFFLKFFTCIVVLSLTSFCLYADKKSDNELFIDNLAPRSFSISSNFSKNELFGKTYFNELIFNKENKEKVKRVVIIDEHPGISYLTIDNALLLPVIFKNFPNAEVISYGGVSFLTKAPKGRVLKTAKKYFIDDYENLIDKKEETVCFFLWENFTDNSSVEKKITKQVTDKISTLSINLNDFGYYSRSYVDIRIPQIKKQKKIDILIHEKDIFSSQKHVLTKLGLQVPEDKNDAPKLKFDDFSIEFIKNINNIYRKIIAKTNNQLKPIIFVNILKGMNAEWLYEDELRHYSKLSWLNTLQNIANTLDVILILNEGPKIWKETKRLFPTNLNNPDLKEYNEHTPWEEVISIYESIESEPKKIANVVRLDEIIDKKNLAALIALTKLSGGVLLDVQTGSSHMAEWFGVPEVLLPVERHNHAIYKRENLIELYRSCDYKTGKINKRDVQGFSDLVLESLNKLIDYSVLHEFKYNKDFFANHEDSIKIAS